MYAIKHKRIFTVAYGYIIYTIGYIRRKIVNFSVKSLKICKKNLHSSSLRAIIQIVRDCTDCPSIQSIGHPVFFGTRRLPLISAVFFMFFYKMCNQK